MSEPNTTGRLPRPDDGIRADATARLDRLTKPRGSLGRLEEIAVWAAGVQHRCPPQPFSRIHVVVVAGDHGVARAAGTSAYPVEVTAQMVANIVTGGAAVNVLARQIGATVRVIDASVAADYSGLSVPSEMSQHRIRPGSGAIDREDAMTAQEAEAALALGQAIAHGCRTSGADLLVIGDMGIGNTTPAAALIAAVTDGDPVTVTGRGTGIDDATWMRKTAAVRDALWRVRRHRDDPRILLQRIGGPDLAVMCGLFLGAAREQLPVVIDGVAVTSAALIAELLDPGCRDWWIAGHRSAEPAHTIALDQLGMQPVLDLNMRLGEGSGALTAIPVIQSAISLVAGMATFDSAGVSDRKESTS